MMDTHHTSMLLDFVASIQGAAGLIGEVRATGCVRRGFGQRLDTLELRLLQTASTLGRIRAFTAGTASAISQIVRELRAEAVRMLLFHACIDAESIHDLERVAGDLGALLAHLQTAKGDVFASCNGLPGGAA